MLVEAEAIPYGPAPLRGERLLVLAPHPDDEVIGCGGLIALHLSDRRPVRVVIATDGAEATGSSGDRGTYIVTREEESRRGLELLGGATEIDFLRFPDRQLDDSVAEKIREHLLSFRPDLVCVPSPIEIHPDHLALSRAFCELIQRDASLFADLAMAQVAFYEVSQPLRPTALVDITDVAEAKYRAIAAHESQIAFKDYVSYARGLNAYRAMTLPESSKAAEAYSVMPLRELRTSAFSELRRRVGHPQPVEIAREALPLSVIVRTKDRPALLREAIDSIRATDYPAEVVVVNDGGATPALRDDIRLVNHEHSRGRAEAMNSGVRAARSKFIAFLDDDDLFYPEHLSTLANAATSARAQAWYSDAVSAFLRVGPSGAWETEKRLRLFGEDFDEELLLADNYIPLTTLLVEREAFLDLGGFDLSFDLFEDWDFLIRLSERGPFVHVPKITCEVRHFMGGGSITLANPEGSEEFRTAKLQVWRKHASRIDNDLIVSVLEKQKRKLLRLQGEMLEEKGRRNHAENSIATLQREKQQLIGELGAVHGSVNEKIIQIHQMAAQIHQLQASIVSLEAWRGRADALANENADLKKALDETQSALRSAWAETDRLQGLLDMIFKSRTWKIHTLLDRLRGRG
jgi:LmbE family N-acetylglucosaminyl deacetylase/GT2 family glycosyltransferase